MSLDHNHKYPPSATRLLAPDTLTLKELDIHLEQGRYRVGQHLINCECVTIESDMHGLIWTRVPLANYTFRKSLRKLKSRIENTFDVRIHPIQHDRIHEDLYTRYLTITDGSRPKSLARVRFGMRPDLDIFETMEVSIWSGDELIAFSWFDQGHKTLQSIIGVYAPEYASYSLGFYSMLAEIEFGIAQGMDYFYAGYILCDNTSMDYKLRTGHVEYLDRAQHRWFPWTPHIRDAQNPLHRIDDALQLLEQQVASHGIDMNIIEHEHFALGAYVPELSVAMPYPRVLSWSTNNHISLIVAWDTVDAHYDLILCDHAYLKSASGELLADNLLIVRQRLGRWQNLREATLATIATVESSLVS